MAPQDFQEEDLPRLLASDLQQYIDLFVRYYLSFVSKEARRLTRSAEDAEDLRQEVFECVHRALKSKSAEEIEDINFRAYLRTTTRNCSLNRLRGKNRFAESLDIPSLQETLVDENTPETAFEHKEFCDKIRGLLNNLPPQQRDALMLKHGCSMNYSDIARLLGIPENRAKLLVKQGKKILKDIISTEDYDSCFK